MKKGQECLKVEGSLVMDIDHLLKGVDKKGYVHTYLGGRQPDGSHLTLELKLNGYEKWIRVLYQTADEEDINGVAEYHIIIEAVQSNLGRGENLYFCCPTTYKRCKKLYLAGDSLHFKHRTAYEQRLYYPSQRLSKNDRIDYRTQQLQVMVEEQELSYHKTHYKGKATKAIHRLNILQYKHWRVNLKRLNYINNVHSREMARIEKRRYL